LDKEKFVSNERLEFLGDAVLDLVIAEYVYKLYPDFNEGALTKLRSQLVNAKM
jgi:RNAse III (EC 3.1.26.3)